MLLPKSQQNKPTYEEMGLFVLYYTDMGEGKGVGFVQSRPATKEDIAAWLGENKEEKEEHGSHNLE